MSFCRDPTWHPMLFFFNENCIAADIYRGRHWRNSFGRVDPIQLTIAPNSRQVPDSLLLLRGRDQTTYHPPPHAFAVNRVGEGVRWRPRCPDWLKLNQRVLTFDLDDGPHARHVHVAERCELGVYSCLIVPVAVSHNFNVPSGLE